ncbi:MAG: hypothetical protein IAE77_04565 [Prosthecobacter sp.]|jgi:hypothetical protein|uniref:DUF5677 domain-containing protein n=1 Tax=Prosthecobacter sp. TaxID=1965333 RepID=UPI001A00C938|nr:DUF5677 domain-containing protein [Prosthecobacter sp.]MBE2282717.1 hypothetical protein [Prosthecobacter sp.]
MSNPIQPPSDEVRAVCDHCDRLIEAYLAELTTRPNSIGRYESEVEFFTLMKLMLRHFESLTVLARDDLVLAPSGNLIARTIFETSVRARWMFVPLDPYEREVRWVLFLRSGTTHAKKLAESTHIPKALISAYDSRKSAYDGFDADICELLAKMDYQIPKQAPNVWEMLKELKEPYLYSFYVLLSAYAHSNFEAASLYKRGLGGAKKLGEFTCVADWLLPFDVAWKSFFLAARDFLAQIEADVARFEQAADLRGFERKLTQLTKA